MIFVSHVYNEANSEISREKLRAVELKRTNECLTQNRRETMKELDEVRRQLETEKDQQ